ncbi:hypothetical protein Tco_0453595 [Tanacetum coccineum]
MSEEDHHVDVGALPKFDMSLYGSEMTAKDVKSLSLRHGIPLDLHPVALTKEWTIDKLPDDMIGLDLPSLLKIPSNSIPLVPFLQTGLFRKRQTTKKGLRWRTPKLLLFERGKQGMLPRKGEIKRESGDGWEGSRPKTKRKKIVVLKDNLVASKATSSLRALRTFDPNQTNPSDVAATTAESQEDRSPLASPRGSTAHSVNYSDAHRVDEETDTLWLRTSRGQSGKVLTNADTEVVRPSLVHHSAHHSPPVTQMVSPLRSIQIGNVDEAWFRELLVHLAPPAAQEESNALNNATALDRALFSLARGALAQNDILERFEHLQTDFDRLAEEHAGCEDTVRQLASARELSQQNSRLYLDISERFRKFKNDHANCPDRFRLLED